MRSRTRQLGLTLVELMLSISLSLVVMLAAGAVYTGVNRSFKQGTHKAVGNMEATLLSTVISRRVRTASGFMIYDVRDRTTPTIAGDGLALLDEDGNVTDRLEWDALNTTLADSTGARVIAMDLQNIRFSLDPVSSRTIRYAYQSFDEDGRFVDIQSAVSLRN